MVGLSIEQIWHHMARGAAAPHAHTRSELTLAPKRLLRPFCEIFQQPQVGRDDESLLGAAVHGTCDAC